MSGINRIAPSRTYTLLLLQLVSTPSHLCGSTEKLSTPGFQPGSKPDPTKSRSSCQSPTPPPAGALGRKGTVHMQNLHSPGAGIGQEAAGAPAASSAAAPLERQSRVRQGQGQEQEQEPPQGLNTTGTGCPGFWELWVIRMDGCCGEESTPPLHMGWPLLQGMECWSTCTLCSGHLVTGKERMLTRELLVGRASVKKAHSNKYE